MSEPLFEIVTSAGDRAEADTPEAAVLAARTLLRDARHSTSGVPASWWTVSIYCDGGLVRSGLTSKDVGA